MISDTWRTWVVHDAGQQPGQRMGKRKLKKVLDKAKVFRYIADVVNNTNREWIMKTFGYTLNDGPDSRHFTNTHFFNLLKTARRAMSELPHNRAYRLIRLIDCGPLNPVDSEVISERII